MIMVKAHTLFGAWQIPATLTRHRDWPRGGAHSSLAPLMFASAFASAQTSALFVINLQLLNIFKQVSAQFAHEKTPRLPV
jgi:hypothetical protein